eukprot:2264799-Prymnesium_polylepis.1
MCFTWRQLKPNRQTQPPNPTGLTDFGTSLFSGAPRPRPRLAPPRLASPRLAPPPPRLALPRSPASRPSPSPRPSPKRCR